MKKFFTNINTLEELKKEYRKLATIYHPDSPKGDLSTMQAINSEYDLLFEELKNKYNKEATRNARTNETSKEYKDIIDALVKYDFVNIDIVGTWLWVYGEYKHMKSINELVKSLGFRWSKSKSKWYWYSSIEKTPILKSKKHFNYEEIKNFHGCENVKVGSSKGSNSFTLDDN